MNTPEELDLLEYLTREFTIDPERFRHVQAKIHEVYLAGWRAGRLEATEDLLE